jgi:hypothetical protein
VSKGVVSGKHQFQSPFSEGILLLLLLAVNSYFAPEAKNLHEVVVY